MLKEPGVCYAPGRKGFPRGLHSGGVLKAKAFTEKERWMQRPWSGEGTHVLCKTQLSVVGIRSHKTVITKDMENLNVHVVSPAILKPANRLRLGCDITAIHIRS